MIPIPDIIILFSILLSFGHNSPLKSLISELIKDIYNIHWLIKIKIGKPNIKENIWEKKTLLDFFCRLLCII